MDLSRAELRFFLRDPEGLGANPRVSVAGRSLQLQPGAGSTSRESGFFAPVDAHQLADAPITVAFSYNVRGNSDISLLPDAAETRWTVQSAWPHPSFGGSFLPENQRVNGQGFKARYQIGSLALGKSQTSSDEVKPRTPEDAALASIEPSNSDVGTAKISLVQPVDPYSQVDRATKYGFLFIGFTFLALLMFDIIGGIRVSGVEYLLMGAALVLFFVLLLAFAEVIGFALAYVAATVAIAGLNSAYSAAVLGSWRRGAIVGGLLLGLYAVLYVLLSLEAFALLIGSLLLFVALAGVMYATRRIDWSASSHEPAYHA